MVHYLTIVYIYKNDNHKHCNNIALYIYIYIYIYIALYTVHYLTLLNCSILAFNEFPSMQFTR